MCTRASIVDSEAAAAAAPALAHARRNHALGILSGTIGGIARDFLSPEIIIVGFVSILTNSWIIAALVPVIQSAGMLAPQMLIGRYVEHVPRKRPYFIGVIFVRAAGLAAMILSLWWITRGAPPAALALFLAAYLLVCVCGGSGHVVVLDMIGRMIPMGRIGSFLGLRTFLGGALAVIIGLKVIQGILYDVPAPDSYLVLAIIGSILMIAEMVCFSFCREEDGPAAKTQTTWSESLRRGWGWLRTNRDYRMYFWQRISFRINYLSLALFIPYGRTQLKNVCSIADVAILGGIFVATLKASRVVGALVWGRLADRRGYRPCFVASGAFFIIAPALALLAPRVPVCFSVSVPLLTTPLNLPLGVYLVALVAIGLGSQAQMIAGNHFRITTAPPHRRVSYAGFLNTITSPLTLLPLAGAYLAETAGPAVLFGLLVASGGFALIMALRMTPGKPSAERTRQLHAPEAL